MAIKYTEKVSELGWAYIERDNGDDTISTIPKDEANADYQAYLNPEAALSTPIVSSDAD